MGKILTCDPKSGSTTPLQAPMVTWTSEQQSCQLWHVGGHTLNSELVRLRFICTLSPPDVKVTDLQAGCSA